MLSAIDWINSNLAHPEGLDLKTLTTVGDFTLMWSIFEASEGEELNNMLGQITNFSNRLAATCPIDLIDSEYNYWVQRYTVEGRKSPHFDYLRLSDDRQVNLVLGTLVSDNPALIAKLEACLLIIYRYRNNLFHGMKDIQALNNQTDNIATAVSLLQKLLPYSRAYWLRITHTH